MVAWDVGADGERMFRVDRVKGVRQTGERFQPRGLVGAGRPMYSRSREDVPVRLLLRTGARWVAEYYETLDITEREDGLEVTIPARQLAWVVKLLLRLGGEATVLDPPELRKQVQEAARETLARYR